MIHSNPSLPELLEWIERYFDCQLSDEEESQLRVIIGSTPLSHQSIDETRALMGFRRHTANKHERSKTQSVKRGRLSILRPAISIAAAIAVIITLGIKLTGHNDNDHQDRATCIAYANGQCITDESAVIRLLTADLQEFSDEADDSDRSLMDELDEITPMIDDSELPAIFAEIAEEFSI